MKRMLAMALGATGLAAATLAHADAYDCFPECTPAADEAPRPALHLCDYAAVREAARVNESLRPVKEAYEIVVNPTGYAIHLVDAHVVHIPKWVGFAMDPKGAIRAKAIAYVRDQAKANVGLADECRDAAAAQASPVDESAGLTL